MADQTPAVDPVAKLQAQVLAFLADARAKAAGGYTFAEFGSLTIELLELLVVGLDPIATLDGAAKKAWALGIVGMLFDSVAGFAVPGYLKPLWFVAKPIVRQLVLALASGALEQVLRLSREAAPSPAPEPAA